MPPAVHPACSNIHPGLALVSAPHARDTREGIGLDAGPRVAKVRRKHEQVREHCAGSGRCGEPRRISTET
jgi:hypothetical protein